MACGVRFVACSVWFAVWMVISPSINLASFYAAEYKHQYINIAFSRDGMEGRIGGLFEL